MQPSPPHFTPPLYPPYQNPYQPQLPGPHDHELKKQYLNLLPPQQIIEICLTFDVHVPIYIRNSVWPQDIHAAIIAIQKSNGGTNTSNGTNHVQVDGGGSANDQASSSKPDGQPVMSSLAETPDLSQTGVSQQSENPPAEPRPPDKPDTSSTSQPQTPSLQPSSSELTSSASDSTTTVADTPTPATAPPSSTPAPTPTSTTAPTSAAPLTTIPPSVPQTPFPHQPYGYPQGHYPHAPYYQHAGYPGYPPSSYHPYSPQIPGAYPGFPQPNPIFANPPLNPAGRPQESFNAMANDDLPSYEEMIVEALMDCADPEGRAPKDLFAWMASKYPLQSNFRPSASQALQKAFKRGRFEKTNGGKYRLNATWEGGNTSRRTTRRPQTQSQTQNAAGASSTGPGSLFTHAPLVHQHQSSPVPHQAPQHPPYPTPPYPYMYPHQPPPPGYPPYPHLQLPLLPPPQQQQQTPTSTEPQLSLGVDGRTSSDTADAYEAAQNILKAINFGELLKLPPEPVDGAVASSSTENSAEKSTTLADGTITDETSVTAQQQQQQVQAAVLPPQDLAGSTHPSAMMPEISTAVRSIVNNTRAELQAQLALLAAQLTEYALENENDGQAQTTTVTTATQATPTLPGPPLQPPPSSAPAGHFPIRNPLSSFSVVPPLSNSLQDPSLIPPGPAATSVPPPAVPANPLSQDHGDPPPPAEREGASPLSMRAEPEEEEESDDDMEEVI